MVAPLLRDDYGAGAEPPLAGASLLSRFAAGEGEPGGRQLEELPAKGAQQPDALDAADAQAGGAARRLPGLAPASSTPPLPPAEGLSRPRFGSLPDLEAQRRQQQEAYWHPQQAQQAQQAHGRRAAA
jgi:hypothetical protein